MVTKRRFSDTINHIQTFQRRSIMNRKITQQIDVQRRAKIHSEKRNRRSIFVVRDRKNDYRKCESGMPGRRIRAYFRKVSWAFNIWTETRKSGRIWPMEIQTDSSIGGTFERNSLTWRIKLQRRKATFTMIEGMSSPLYRCKGVRCWAKQCNKSLVR